MLQAMCPITPLATTLHTSLIAPSFPTSFERGHNPPCQGTVHDTAYHSCSLPPTQLQEGLSKTTVEDDQGLDSGGMLDVQDGESEATNHQKINLGLLKVRQPVAITSVG